MSFTSSSATASSSDSLASSQTEALSMASSTAALASTTNATIQTEQRLQSSNGSSSWPVITDYPTNEFELSCIPRTVIRKQFSSLELLRLAQTSDIVASTAVWHKRGGASVNTSRKQQRTKANVVVTSNNQQRRRAKLHKSSKDLKRSMTNQLLLSETDAQWFLQLPETVKRKHFTDAERVILQARCDTLVDRAQLLVPPKLTIMDNESFTTLSIISVNNRSKDSVISHQDFRESFDAWKSQEDIRAKLTLQDYQGFKHATTSTLLVTPLAARRGSSVRRTLSLSRSDRNSSTSPSPISLHTKSHSTSQSVSLPSRRAPQHTSRPSFDQDATYWQDPDARLKLRLYLASPQKFDEAIEFGFPARTESKRPSTSNVKKTEFTVETTEIDSEESRPVKEYTTRPLSQHGHRTAASKETLSPHSQNTTRPRPRHVGLAAFPEDIAAGREMTLRMTLTRADLRANEKDLYGWRTDDPLALEALPPPNDDVLGTCGPFDNNASGKHPNLVRSLWRKVKNAPRRASTV